MALSFDQQTYFRRTTQDFGVPEGATNFKSDSFVGDGTTTNFNLSHAPDLTNYTPVILYGGAMQDTAQAVIVGSVLMFGVAPVFNGVVVCNYQY